MILFLTLNIVLTVALFSIFKLFGKYKIDNLQAIVVNYFVAGLIGYFITVPTPLISEIVSKEWFVHAVWLGFLFVSLFLILAISAQKIGVAVTTTANKISVVIPVLFGILILGESYSWQKIIGVVLAIISILFVTGGDGQTKLNWRNFLLPLLLFIGGGIIDTSLGVIQTRFVPESEASWFTITLFWISGALGGLILIGKLALKKTKLHAKSLIAGIVLGVPNYFSIYFLLRAIDTEVLETSAFFPVANLGSILFATLVSRLFFGERLTNKKYIGIVLSIFAIGFIVWKELF